jgi:multidrug resistance efflux pump
VRVALFALIALSGGLLAASLIVWCPPKSYPGHLTARIIPVTHHRPGVLSEWFVGEGEQVTVGQQIAALADPTWVPRRVSLAEQLERLELEQQQSAARAELELEWRTKELNADIFAAKLQSAELLEERYRHEMDRVALSDMLSSSSTASWSDETTVFDALVLPSVQSTGVRMNTVLRIEAATNSADVCAAQVELCEQQVNWLEDLKESLEDRVAQSAGVEATSQQIAAIRQQIEALETEDSRQILTATAIGRAGNLCKRLGDFVDVGEPIVEIVDDAHRFVIAHIPSTEIGRVRVGQDVELRFPGRELRTGRISEIAPQAKARSGDGPTISTKIEQTGRAWPVLPIGVELRVVLR